MSDGFPSAYKFESEEEKAAKARRLARFNNPAPSSNGNGVAHAVVPDYGIGAGVGGLGARISGMQVGKNKLSSIGYEPEVAEVDPVSEAVAGGADFQNVMDWDHHTIRGTSTRLEKSYLRLTSVSLRVWLGMPWLTMVGAQPRRCPPTARPQADSLTVEAEVEGESQLCVRAGPVQVGAPGLDGPAHQE